MRIFTISSGLATPGVKVCACTVMDEEKTFPAIVVGEHTARTHLGILPVFLTDDQYRELLAGGEATIYYGTLKTVEGNVRLFAQNSPDQESGEILCVFLTATPRNGHNLHGGDVRGRALAPENPRSQPLAVFPGRIIARGNVFRGEDTHDRYGAQLIAVIPKGKLFAVRTAGYNDDDEYLTTSHSFLWDGTVLRGGFTDQERRQDPKIFER